MRVLFRLLSVYLFFTLIGTFTVVVRMWSRGAITSLTHSGAIGILTIAGWLITFIAGAPAVVLLWKQKNAGRIAAAVMWASICFYYVACAVLFHSLESLRGRASIYMLGSAALVFLLLSSKARQACKQPSLPTHVEMMEKSKT
jgi:hypothetical protein